MVLSICFCSDDRSAEVFQKRIDTATQMKSVLGSNEKPNCLIIDEIDGAPSVRSDNFFFFICKRETLQKKSLGTTELAGEYVVLSIICIYLSSSVVFDRPQSTFC